ncbi:hypothetical protein [Paenibacillus apiarius]|uniref:Uncharacterized protein n=1 Tax=Paenibacillus apiarius TaxID=46240 RepID=A0ABT4DTU7_9BACL|nr:hypothetical protein [Paenibacillus apiarius]MCY9515872.1 hypothetical protein [Paenibacillus apiarius]MCY9520782.1 hypothetical protein [Paenibacillus apiarius]MCY9553486.1 hypothetical protein [Paenibacillus apiarius]MCY9557990.1 hypothetical protein [Paenibacillus apiarius]MCY9685845.1 hypothetical protein [Paenibacillus apiarius]
MEIFPADLVPDERGAERSKADDAAQQQAVKRALLNRSRSQGMLDISY